MKHMGVVVAVLGIVGSCALADGKTASAAAKNAVAGARQAIEAYVAAALDGRDQDASALGVSGTGRKETVEKFRTLLGVKSLKIVTVLASDTSGQATAVSDAVKLTKANPDGRNTGVMSFLLVRTSGKWLVKDIDFDTEAKAKSKVDEFRKRYTDAAEAPTK